MCAGLTHLYLFAKRLHASVVLVCSCQTLQLHLSKLCISHLHCTNIHWLGTGSVVHDRYRWWMFLHASVILPDLVFATIAIDLNSPIGLGLTLANVWCSYKRLFCVVVSKAMHEGIQAWALTCVSSCYIAQIDLEGLGFSMHSLIVVCIFNTRPHSMWGDVVVMSWHYYSVSAVTLKRAWQAVHTEASTDACGVILLLCSRN